MELSTKKRKLIFGLFLLSGFAASFLATALVTALPNIIKDLGVDVKMGQWFTSGYGIAMGIFILFTPYLLQRFSVKKVYLVSMLFFIIGAALSGFAGGFVLMMAGRLLQACGNGVINTMSQVVILSIYPKEKRGLAMGWYGVSIGAAPVLSPVLTGLVVDMFGWQWIFYGVGIVMALALVLVFFFVDEHLQTKQESLFLDFHVLKEKVFRYSVIGSCLLFFLMMGAAILLPLYIQETMGRNAAVSGFVALPGALALSAASPAAGKAYDKMGIRKLLIIGCSFLILGNLGMCFVTKETPLWIIALFHGFRGTAQGAMMMPLMTWGNSVLQKEKVASGTSLINAFRTLAGSFGAMFFVWIASTFGEENTKGGGMIGQRISCGSMALAAVFSLAAGCYYLSGCQAVRHRFFDKGKTKSFVEMAEKKEYNSWHG